MCARSRVRIAPCRAITNPDCPGSGRYFRVPAEQTIKDGVKIVEQLDFVKQENGIRVLFQFFLANS